MPASLMLEGKHAVVFGGGGSIGTAVAKELATEGAEVFLAGRTSAGVEAAARQITAAGGRAHAAVIDTLDAPAVDDYVEAVVQQAGSLDIEFNATGPRVNEYGNGECHVVAGQRSGGREIRTPEGLPPTRFPTMLASVHRRPPPSANCTTTIRANTGERSRTEVNETETETEGWAALSQSARPGSGAP
jgi:NAD(P)-dependent dehydrogenase (short-subunit alcohol dehydrogenase family)